MFWGKKSTLKRDVKAFKEIIDQINDVDDGFLTKSNAKREYKSILKTLYPDKYNDYDSDDWSDHLYEFSQSDYWYEYEYLDDDLESLKEELIDAKAEGDEDYVQDVHKQISELKLSIKFYKKDASDLFISRLHNDISSNQKNDNESNKFKDLTKDMNFDVNNKINNLVKAGLL